MIERYGELTGHTVSASGLPSLEVHYERLTSHPARGVDEIADFIGVGHRRRKAATGVIGKRRALIRYYGRRTVWTIARWFESSRARHA